MNGIRANQPNHTEKNSYVNYAVQVFPALMGLTVIKPNKHPELFQGCYKVLRIVKIRALTSLLGMVTLTKFIEVNIL
jgi:hypothetical protein